MNLTGLAALEIILKQLSAHGTGLLKKLTIPQLTYDIPSILRNPNIHHRLHKEYATCPRPEPD
jgi:hypothetical protein